MYLLSRIGGCRAQNGETKSPFGFGASYAQAEPESPDDGVGLISAQPGDHPLELAGKLSQLIDKLAAYKRKCDALKKRNTDAHGVIKKMEAEISQLQDELELQQAQNDGNIMARLGIDQAKVCGVRVLQRCVASYGLRLFC
jgi:hypothetical protein